jgi:hypothetical protein
MNGESICIEQNPSMRLVARRKFIDVAALSGAGVVSLDAHGRFARSAEDPVLHGQSSEPVAPPNGGPTEEELKNEKIRRAMLAGPSIVTAK